MIIVRTPLRLEFLGGSTDIANFYRRSPGKILNAAINKYVTVIVQPRPDKKLRLIYDTVEYADRAGTVSHSRTRAALRHFRIRTGLDIVSASPLLTQGAGLGSSGSFTVGLVNALSLQRGKKLPPRELAEIAARLEIDVLKEPIGKQDQYVAAFGGLNAYTFHKDGSVKIVPVKIPKKKLRELTKHMLVFHTGAGHSASAILKKQHNQLEANFPKLQKMAAQVATAVRMLEAGDWKKFGQTLAREWEIKRTLSQGITSSAIEAMRKKAKKAGAWESRLSGAGGGGFLVVIAHPRRHAPIIRALAGHPLFPVEIGVPGSEVVFSD